jgi:hypothetical protein
MYSWTFIAVFLDEIIKIVFHVDGLFTRRCHVKSDGNTSNEISFRENVFTDREHIGIVLTSLNNNCDIRPAFGKQGF